MLSTAELTQAKRYMQDALAKSERADIWLEMAEHRVGREYFGSSFTLALAYMAQHIGVLEDRNGDEVGSISSISEGGISISYSAAGGGTNDDLLATNFGRAYLDLRASKRPALIVSGGWI